MLQFTNVLKSYGRNKVLDIPDFRLDPGIYWLQGPNGAGKTTLLRRLLAEYPGFGLVQRDDKKDIPVACPARPAGPDNAG